MHSIYWMKTSYLNSESLSCYLSLSLKDMALVTGSCFILFCFQEELRRVNALSVLSLLCRVCQSRNTSTELKCCASILSPLTFPSFAQVLLEGKFTGSHQHCKLCRAAHHPEVWSWKGAARLSTQLCSKEFSHLMELSRGLPPPPALRS